jgi:DNA-binding CsgD family transcriptional regulator
MFVNDELPSLLRSLYAAPLEPENWQVFFSKLCVLTNTDTGYMLTSDPERGNSLIAGGGLNFDPEVLTRYNEQYRGSDPYQAPFEASPRVGVIEGEDLVPHADLVKTEIWNELLSRYDLEYMTMVVCKHEARSVDLFSLWRSPRHTTLDARANHLLEALVPHVRTALQLRSKLEASNACVLLAETALDAMNTGAFLVDSRGYLRHMNKLATAYLRSAESLQIYEGKLVAADSSQDAQLQGLIKRATARPKHGVIAACGGAMYVSRLRTPSAFQVAVVPAPEQGGMAEQGPCALIFVIDGATLPRGRASLMCQLFSLTPTEARMADLLLQGLEMREAAERLRISIATARFHLKRVFVKTHTHRQTELMRLMLSLPGQADPQEQFIRV